MHRPTPAIRGLYAITPDEADSDVLRHKVLLALQGGARIVQYRNKSADMAEGLAQAQALRALTRAYGALFIVNDDPQLALAVDADGVHLGRGDTPFAEARGLLGTAKIIGVSCYNQLPLAQAARAGGADYVAFGAFFSSSVKPDAVTADLDLLRAARAEIDAPIVAIGGITAQNGAVLVDAGADALAVISALFGAPDIPAAAKDFAKLFNRTQSS
ncbi:MAG TPA: thiamine phosphate synthase [Gallionellaceae bacterium]|nr:thiamine phosphate synthase [Gallionellaceae bacterium]